MEFKWSSIDDASPQSSTRRISNNCFSETINAIITSFSIRPPKQYIGNPKLKSVSALGLTLDEFSSACKKLGELDQLGEQLISECSAEIKRADAAREAINASSTQQKALEEKIEELEEKRSVAEADANAAEHQLHETEQRLTKMTERETSLSVRCTAIEDTIDQKTKESTSLNTQIEERRLTLAKLKENINLFPSEISGFVTQGAANILRYTALAAVPIAILVIYSVVLFSNANNLATVYRIEPGIELWTMFLSRLPFVTISAFIIHACYKLAKIFIAEIMRINQQRLLKSTLDTGHAYGMPPINPSCGIERPIFLSIPVSAYQRTP